MAFCMMVIRLVSSFNSVAIRVRCAFVTKSSNAQRVQLVGLYCFSPCVARRPLRMSLYQNTRFVFHSEWVIAGGNKRSAWLQLSIIKCTFLLRSPCFTGTRKINLAPLGVPTLIMLYDGNGEARNESHTVAS